MVDFKLCISDPKTGKSYQKEVKDNESSQFMGKNIGETVSGDAFGLAGYEFTITGGSDNSGFPMRRGIRDLRKRLNLAGGVGIRENLSKGIKIRKTVCGHKINTNIVQINLKPSKEGAKPLAEIFPAKEKADAPKQ